VDEKVLELAKARTPAGLHVNWLRTSATALPAEDGTCAIVTDRGCMHHLDDIDSPQYAAEVERVLAPGGAWVIRDMLGHSHQHGEVDPERLAELVTGSALTIESVVIRDFEHAGHHAHKDLLVVVRKS
jgi:ubiquinone/menaquinone biosynthesis C-methylase UbiE